ncbi:hypothetical protein [Prescottella subtropica]|uniref:hypothetical protein n=1 Tax=Prescottella subtropica TaxID=2545757 RepID=UPI0010F5015C|nr:hypothetical protein [Prescottella subtropica]
MKARKLVIVALVAAVVAVLAYSFLRTDTSTDGAAASTSTTSSTVPPVPAAPSTDVDVDVDVTEPSASSRDAEESIRQALTVIYTWYPSADATQNDAYGRARDWLTDQLAARMIIDARTERGQSVQWGQWAQQQAKVIADVTVECSGCPADTDTVVQRVVTIKQTAVTGSRTQPVTPDTTVWVTAVRDGDRWLVDEIRH